MNNTFDLLVGKDVAYKAKTGGGVIAGINEIDLLAPGAVAIFTDSGLMVETATAAAALVGVKQFYFAMGRTNDVKLSNRIDRDAFHRVKCAYVAPTLQITTITPLNLPTTYINGEEGEVSVFFNEPGREPAVTKERFSASTRITDTNTTYVQRIVDKINLNSKYVTAAMVGAGVSIVLTAKVKNFKFDTAVTGPVLENAIATITTPVVYSQGQADDLVELETQSRIYNGDTNKIWYSEQFYSQERELVAGTNYVCYDIHWATESRGSIKAENVAQPGVLAVFPTGAAVITSLDTILALLLTAMPSTNSGGTPFATL